MKELTFQIKSEEATVRETVIIAAAEKAAQVRGLITSGENLPQGSVVFLRKDGSLNPFIQLRIPEDTDQLERFEDLMKDVNLGE